MTFPADGSGEQARDESGRTPPARGYEPPPIEQYGYPAPPPGDPYRPIDYPSDYPDPGGFVPPYAPPPPMPPPYPGGYPPPAPPYPGYPMYPGYGPPPPAGTNGLAIGSLVCGLIGTVFCTLFVPSLVAIVLGVVALNQIGRTGQGGRPLAIAGLSLGAATLVIGFVMMVVIANS